jgi:hypothetical protein
MTQPPTVNTVAPLQNVHHCMQAMRRVMERRDHLPGLIGFYGPSGFGKSTAAAYVANRYQAYYVEVKSNWPEGAFLKAVLSEMGIKPERRNYDMVDQISQQLALSGRPLIIDEFDHVVKKGYPNTIKDIYEGSHTGIMVIGEELLEANIARDPDLERLHNRFLEWVAAEPADLNDAEHMRALYYPALQVEQELMQEVLIASKHELRRIVVNLDRFNNLAVTEGLDKVTRAAWGNRGFFTGHAQKRRV